MRNIIRSATASLLFTGAAMAQDRIVISSEWGDVTAELAGNETIKALVEMLPITLDMRDHLRQEKTGGLPSSLPQAARQLDFVNGTLGLWGSTDFVIYYRDGSVPRPGIVILGRIEGDASIFDRPGSITVAINRADSAF